MPGAAAADQDGGQKPGGTYRRDQTRNEPLVRHLFNSGSPPFG